MNSGPAHDVLLPVDIQSARVSTVAVQRVPTESVPRFLECQRGLTEAAKRFQGYQSTELYPPADERAADWVAIIHFDDEKSLANWIDSPVRAKWIEKLREEVGEFELKTLPSGFGVWFAGLATGPEAEPPPSWKIAMTVLLGLYPTVMLLAVLFGRFLSPLGMSASMLISNTLSVAIGQWVTMPLLTNIMGGWLKANSPGRRAFSFGMLVAIWLFLGGLVVLFRFVTG